MRYYSTKNKSEFVSLREAVTRGLAPDHGLYMPETVPGLPASFFKSIRTFSFQEMAYRVVEPILGEDVPTDELRRIVDHTIQFETPLVQVEPGIHALELFHGPTMAFKDFGARFMSQLFGYFARSSDREIVILVATSGDTGSAVANGFLGVEGTRVIVLYPSGKVSEIQEKQFTTLGRNVQAVEVSGTFDDCQRLVKEAFMDSELRARYFLTSANSINIARLLPQSFYYFDAYRQSDPIAGPLVFSVPSGNFGNLTAGLIARRMGLPVEKFIAATNINDIVPKYLETGLFEPRASSQTISNAMDVGNPSNFDRMLDLYNHDLEALRDHVMGCAFTDDDTRAIMQEVFARTGYVMDPHGAVAYLGLKKYLKQSGSRNGVFLETAHPGKFLGVVEESLSSEVPLPDRLKTFLAKEKQSLPSGNTYGEFRSLLAGILG